MVRLHVQQFCLLYVPVLVSLQNRKQLKDVQAAMQSLDRLAWSLAKDRGPGHNL